MISAPLFVVLLLVAVMFVKNNAVDAGGVFLGVLLGLSLASTSVGGPMLAGLTAISSGLVDILGSLGNFQ
jgi:hypothetical protein